MDAVSPWRGKDRVDKLSRHLHHFNAEMLDRPGNVICRSRKRFPPLRPSALRGTYLTCWIYKYIIEGLPVSVYTSLSHSFALDYQLDRIFRKAENRFKDTEMAALARHGPRRILRCSRGVIRRTHNTVKHPWYQCDDLNKNSESMDI